MSQIKTPRLMIALAALLTIQFAAPAHAAPACGQVFSEGVSPKAKATVEKLVSKGVFFSTFQTEMIWMHLVHRTKFGENFDGKLLYRFHGNEKEFDRLAIAQLKDIDSFVHAYLNRERAPFTFREFFKSRHHDGSARDGIRPMKEEQMVQIGEALAEVMADPTQRDVFFRTWRATLPAAYRSAFLSTRTWDSMTLRGIGNALLGAGAGIAAAFHITDGGTATVLASMGLGLAGMGGLPTVAIGSRGWLSPSKIVMQGSGKFLNLIFRQVLRAQFALRAARGENAGPEGASSEFLAAARELTVKNRQKAEDATLSSPRSIAEEWSRLLSHMTGLQVIGESLRIQQELQNGPSPALDGDFRSYQLDLKVLSMRTEKLIKAIETAPDDQRNTPELQEIHGNLMEVRAALSEALG